MNRLSDRWRLPTLVVCGIALLVLCSLQDLNHRAAGTWEKQGITYRAAAGEQREPLTFFLCEDPRLPVLNEVEIDFSFSVDSLAGAANILVAGSGERVIALILRPPSILELVVTREMLRSPLQCKAIKVMDGVAPGRTYAASVAIDRRGRAVVRIDGKVCLDSYVTCLRYHIGQVALGMPLPVSEAADENSLGVVGALHGEVRDLRIAYRTYARNLPVILLKLAWAALCLVLLGCVVAGKARDEQRKLAWVVTLLFVTVAAVVFLNCAAGAIHVSRLRWERQETIERSLLLGKDYHYIHTRVRAFLSSGPGGVVKSVYPPFVTLFNLPTCLLPYRSAYVLQVLLLIAANTAVIALGVSLGFRVFGAGAVGPERDPEGQAALLLQGLFAVSFAALQFTSYGFLFSIERGNYDIFAMLFSVLCIASTLGDDRRVWLPCLFAAIAVNLKLYPAILVPFLLLRFRGKAVLPLLGFNVVFLLALGPADLMQYCRDMAGYAREHHAWIGNHSGASYAHLLAADTGLDEGALRLACTVGPLLIWALGFVAVQKRWRGDARAVLHLSIAVFPMAVVPAASHDYKLVIFIVPLILNSFLLFSAYMESRSPGRQLLLLFLFVAMAGDFMLLSRSFAEAYVCLDKYPFIIVLQLISTIAVMALAPQEPAPACGNAAGPPPAADQVAEA